MNLLWSVRVPLTIFLLIEGTFSSKEIWLNKDDSRAPLGVIKKRDSTLELAIPQEFNADLASYIYDDTEDEKGLKEEFLVACSTRDSNSWLYQVERYLKNNYKLFEDSELLTTLEYDGARCPCQEDLNPSIEKLENKNINGDVKYCKRSGERLYAVGYPVYQEDNGTDFKFMTMYQICYSIIEDEEMPYYTIHRIVAPKMMLQKLWEFYELDPKATFKTFLDERDFDTKPLNKKQYAYQYVGFDDMPTKAWERTTLFSLNYTLIPKNKDLLQGLITVDNFIRLFSKETEKPLTLYSGSLKTTATIPPKGCLKPFCKPERTKINSFWRIVMDETADGFNAILVVTHLTQIECSHSYICDKNRDVIYKYKKGGCTYTCSVDNETKQSLGLYHLQITGDLDLKFRQKIPKKQRLQLEPQSFLGNVNPPKIFGMSDFIGKVDFMSVLKVADAELAKEVQVQSKIQGFQVIRVTSARKSLSENRNFRPFYFHA